ncbi:MAG TPA: hypothetical protein VGF99_15325 [Myxococcota bacterium]
MSTTKRFANAWLLERLQAADVRERAARRAWTLLGVGLGGVALGAAVAVLLTPKRGHEVRESVARRFAPFMGLNEEVTRPEKLSRIIDDDRAELAAKVHALNDDGIDVDSVVPRDRTIV